MCIYIYIYIYRRPPGGMTGCVRTCRDAGVLLKSCRNGVSHTTGRFVRDILRLLFLHPVTTFLEYHTTRAGGRPNFAERYRFYDYRCYDYAKMLRFNQHNRNLEVHSKSNT